MKLALAVALFLQDPTIDAHVKALSHEDIAVRDKATRELEKLPLEKLPDLEKHLKNSDAETAVRLRRVMAHVLASNLGSRKSRFEMRPVADQKTLDDWIAAGADSAKPPKGLEARRFHAKATKPEGGEWTLVEGAKLSEREVSVAEAVPDVEMRPMDGMGWLVRIDLTAEGAKKFDELAARLYRETPRGRLAILLDERVLVAPLVNAERFGGRAVIQGNFTEEEARGVARALKGDWLESSIRMEKSREAAAPEKAADFLRGVKGLEKVAIQPDAGGLDISGYLDIKEVDLVSLWQSLRERGYRLAAKK